MVVVTLVCLSLLVGGAVVTSWQDPTDKNQELTFIILISCTLIIAILLLVLIYVWCTDYLIKIERTVSKIPNLGRRATLRKSNTVRVQGKYP